MRVVRTSARSWAEADVKSLLTSGQVSLDEAKGDKKGPIAIASVVSAPSSPPDAVKLPADTEVKAETRVAVFGDSDFVANSGLGIQGNWAGCRSRKI